MTSHDSWITDYLNFSDNITSPLIFRTWSAIATVSAALNRKVYAKTPQILYPNLIVTLIGGPGIGKSATISRVRSLAQDAENVPISPPDMTREAMLDVLADTKPPICERIETPNGDDIDEYHSLFLCIAELGIFIRENDLHMLSTLCGLYDCDMPSFQEVRRGRGSTIEEKTLTIPNPQITMLAGVTPGHMAEKFPAEAWQMGFMARNILIYSSEVIQTDLFATEDEDDAGRQALVNDLRRIAAAKGQFKWTQEAQDEIKRWYRGGCMPVPEHPRLHHYNTRRILQILKLSIVLRASRLAHSPVAPRLVTAEDVTWAMHLLFHAESQMHGIFAEMAGRSDSQILNDLYAHLWLESKAGQREIHEQRIYSFLQGRSLAWQIESQIQLLIKMDLIARNGKNPKLFTVKPRKQEKPS